MPVSVSGDSLRIDGFKTNEPNIVRHFSALSNSDRNDGAVADLLATGIIARNSLGTTLDTRYVETAFGHLKDEFDRKISDMFDPDGTFADVLERHFGQDGKIVREVFDPDSEGTPLNKLKAALHVELDDIQNLIAKTKGHEMEAKKGTQKGVEFEDLCQPLLEEMARAHSDTVERTSSVGTDGGEGKKGDFVITLDGTGKKIVFEMKHRAGMSASKIKTELDGAIKGRGADYAVLISRNRDMLSQDVGWFNEYDGNKLVCALAEAEDYEINEWVIGMAYRWARTKVASARDRQLDIDPEVVKQNVLDIEASMNRLVGIKKQCRSIVKSAESIEEKIAEEEDSIRGKIADTIRSMDRNGADQ